MNKPTTHTPAAWDLCPFDDDQPIRFREGEKWMDGVIYDRRDAGWYVVQAISGERFIKHWQSIVPRNF